MYAAHAAHGSIVSMDVCPDQRDSITRLNNMIEEAWFHRIQQSHRWRYECAKKKKWWWYLDNTDKKCRGHVTKIIWSIKRSIQQRQISVSFPISNSYWRNEEEYCRNQKKIQEPVNIWGSGGSHYQTNLNFTVCNRCDLLSPQ